MNIEYAWCAGFFDGEGCSSRVGRRVQTQVGQVNRAPLDRFAAALGGKVYGPYGPYSHSRKGTQPIYRWEAYGRSSVSAMRKMWPYLCDAKKEQFVRAFRSRA